jgi:hypothetical protein
MIIAMFVDIVFISIIFTHLLVSTNPIKCSGFWESLFGSILFGLLLISLYNLYTGINLVRLVFHHLQQFEYYLSFNTYLLIISMWR